jgi:hypothetical protein
MFNIITRAFLAPIIGAFFYLDGYNIIKNNVVVKYKKFRKINNLVSTNYKGFFTIMWISLCMVTQALWLSLIQYMNSTIIPIKGGRYKVTYVIKGKIYKMIVKPVRGPVKVLLVSNDKQEDVSCDILPYLGPEDDFHNKKYTPRFFDHNELIFEMFDGQEKIFKADDSIILN